MDIVEFFELTCGKWFSQRTSHHLAVQKLESGKSDVVIEKLEPADASVQALCEQCHVDPAIALLGLKVTWTGGMEWDAKQGSASTLLVAIADGDDPNHGKLLRQQGINHPDPVVGRYSLGADEALTLITEQDDLYAEERWWFASPNLRLRSSVLKQGDGYSTSAFCSEIRMGLGKKD